MPLRKRIPDPPVRTSGTAVWPCYPGFDGPTCVEGEETIVPTIAQSTSLPLPVSSGARVAHNRMPTVDGVSVGAYSTETPRSSNSLCTLLSHRFETGMLKLSDCCCNRLCRRSQSNSLHGSQDRLLPPLEPDEYCQPEDSEQFNTQVVDWMRRRLIYFFMSPREKFYAKQRIPYKLFVQLLKVVLITMQLIVFGQDRSAHVSFGENSRLAFSHLYLRDWNPQYETLDYPPASGPYAAYQQDEFYLMLGYTITQFNKTESIAIGSYLFTSDKPFLTFCRVSVADRGLMTHTEETHCADLYPKDVPADSLSTASGVRQLLANYNLSVNFARLLKFTMEFEILSPIVTELGWRREAECFKFQIHISMEKIQQSGQLQIYLDAPYTATYCEEAEHTKPTRGRTEWLRHFWLTMSQTHRNLDNRTSEVSFSFSTRRMIIASLNSVVLVIGILSTVLCIRSIVRGFILWKETVLFFRHWYSIELRGHFWDFIPPWFIAIIFTDAIIIYGAVYNLWTLNGLHQNPEPTSYVFGISALLVWSGVLRYVGFSYTNSILMRTIINSIPALLRFGVCSLILFFAFSLCGWVVLGPYNLKFRTFITTLECLYALINGDDMFVTFSVIGERAPWGIFLFSRLFLYVFITLFIYVVLNLFITIIFEAYEEVKEMRDTRGRPHDSLLFTFIHQARYDCQSPLFQQDDTRADRRRLHDCALGKWPSRDPEIATPSSPGTESNIKANRRYFPWRRRTQSCSQAVQTCPTEQIDTVKGPETHSSSPSFVSQRSSSSNHPEVHQSLLAQMQTLDVDEMGLVESRTLVSSPQLNTQIDGLVIGTSHGDVTSDDHSQGNVGYQDRSYT
ncbi:Mucolipin-3 [Clonorchis sinensis]|uniref:Mucolipin-3 n=1 Tax=Clonorchis sinensis TaxID=79923 RepID=A0A8T1N1X3_CLOSI|nr:Mucolipin-3 [Clonorchis sinensis]